MRSKRAKTIRVEASSLRIHPVAQRKLSPVHLKRIMDTLDLDAIGFVHVVSYPVNGEEGIYVIDGQHRITALLRHGLGDWVVDAVLHEDVDNDARASELFLELNNRAVVGAFDKFANKVSAGDPVAVGTKKTCERFGLKVDRASRDGYISCVSVAEKIYGLDNGSTLADTLELATGAWGRTAGAVEGKLLDGLAIVFDNYNGELDRPALLKKLSKYPGGATGLIGDAKGLRKLRRSALSRCVAESIVEVYNSGRRVGRLPAL